MILHSNKLVEFALFTPGETGYPQVSEHWYLTRDGNRECFAMYRRHYSSRKNEHPDAAPADYPGLVWREVSYLVVLDASNPSP